MDKDNKPMEPSECTEVFVRGKAYWCREAHNTSRFLAAASKAEPPLGKTTQHTDTHNETSAVLKRIRSREQSLSAEE